MSEAVDTWGVLLGCRARGPWAALGEELLFACELAGASPSQGLAGPVGPRPTVKRSPVL